MATMHASPRPFVAAAAVGADIPPVAVSLQSAMHVQQQSRRSCPFQATVSIVLEFDSI